MMEGQNFHHQIVSTLKAIEPIVLFKIFGEEYFSFESAKYRNLVDWSGFYTQLTPVHSMRYLTKKWDDGADLGCLISLTPVNKAIRVLEIKHQKLASSKISGQLKAMNIKKHLSQTYQEFKEINQHLLLKYLGRHLVVMKCVDSEDQEYIIPHQMLHAQNFQARHLMHFKKSQDGMLRTVSYRIAQGHWTKTPNEYQFQPYLIVQDQTIRVQIEKLIAQKAQLIKDKFNSQM